LSLKRCTWICPKCGGQCEEYCWDFGNGKPFPHGSEHRCECTEKAFLAKLNPEQLIIRENCHRGKYPKGACPIRDGCPTADLACYGSMCDDCANTCKGGEGGKNFSIGACDKYIEKNIKGM
jgi:hypothetical protein